jgi:hypothetical protein
MMITLLIFLLGTLFGLFLSSVIDLLSSILVGEFDD